MVITILVRTVGIHMTDSLLRATACRSMAIRAVLVITITRMRLPRIELYK